MLESDTGQVVLEEEYIVQDASDPPLTYELAAGVYLLTHYERPCNLTCDFLGPKVDECRRLLELPPGAVIEPTISVSVGSPCSIEHLSGSEG